MCEARNDAVVNELLWRDMNKHQDTARAGEAGSTRAHESQIYAEPLAPSAPKISYVTLPVSSDGSRKLFPTKYAVDNRRIADDMIMDDLGLTKLTPNGKIIAANVKAVMRRDLVTARKIQDQIEKRGEHNRCVRSEKKGRKRIIAKERIERDRPGEPNSGDEGGSGAARN